MCVERIRSYFLHEIQSAYLKLNSEGGIKFKDGRKYLSKLIIMIIIVDIISKNKRQKTRRVYIC